MRTEYDLRTAIDELAQDAPDVEHVLAAVTRPHRRRMLAPLAVAAAVLAVAGGVAVATADRGSSPGPATAAESIASVAHPCATYGRPDLRTFSIGHVAGLADQQDSPAVVTGCSGYSARTVYAPNGRQVGQVTVYRAGVFDTSRLANVRAVHGHGIAGFSIPPAPYVTKLGQGDVKCVFYPPGSNTQSEVPRVLPVATICADTPTLAWEYAPNAWATVTSSDDTTGKSIFGDDPTDKQLELAAAVDTKHPIPLRVPFAFGDLPADVRITNVYSYLSRSGKPVAVTVGFGITGRPGCPSDADCEQVGEVSLVPQRGNPSQHGEPVSINGYPAHLIDQGEVRPDIELTYQTGTWNVLVGEAADRRIPDSDLIAIARGLRYATSTTDQSTWFPAP